MEEIKKKGGEGEERGLKVTRLPGISKPWSHLSKKTFALPKLLLVLLSDIFIHPLEWEIKGDREDVRNGLQCVRPSSVDQRPD